LRPTSAAKGKTGALLIVCRLKGIIINIIAPVRKPNSRAAFGQNVRGIRLKLGWSQEELAERAGLHRTYIGSIERGERNISLDNIIRLALALRTTPSALLKGVN